MEATAKVTRKYQTTLPRPVREALGIRIGDAVVFRVEEGGEVVLRRADPLDISFLESLDGTLGEWLSDEDDAAYGEL